MTDANPYTAPDAMLDSGQDDLYEPSIFSFKGRLGRMRYVAYNFGLNLLMMAIAIPLIGGAAFMSGGFDLGGIGGIAYIVLNVAALVISVMFGKRRLNDLNRSGWWMLLLIVPLVNLILVIYMIAFSGSDGSNKWGAAPVANSLGVQILFWVVILFFVGGIAMAVLLPAMMASGM